MRKIKFRVWSSSKEKWVTDHETFYYNPGDKTINQVFNSFQLESGIIFQQYIGLKDASAGEIYEGDIISCDEYMGDGMKDYHRPVAVVMFDGCSWCYSLDKTRNWKNPHQILRYANNVKVIGNIFENPELLK